MTGLIYAGVGSRQTPLFIRTAMTSASYKMSQDGWHLRSGYATGADQAWGLGAAKHSESSLHDRWTMYLPWQGYNNAPSNDDRFQTVIWNQELEWETRAAYNSDPLIKMGKPHWDQLKSSVQLLHMRNTVIVLGENLDEPAACVLGWTPNGDGSGGTGQAYRVAQANQIPVFDLAIELDRHMASEFIYDKTSEYWGIPW